MILKTYTRLFTTDLSTTLAILEPLYAGAPHLRFVFGAWELVAIGDILVVAGTAESLAPIRASTGPWVVDDLERTRETLVQLGSTITLDPQDSETGRFFYARHPDGIEVEYVQWKPELVEAFIEAPRRNGVLASQIGAAPIEPSR